LEGDKLDPEGIQAVWDGMMKPIIERLGPLAGKTLVASLIDSYEVGGQNWTSRMPEEFKKARGYDITTFLPPFTGRTIDSPGSDGTVPVGSAADDSDLFARNYFQAFTALCNNAGLKSMAQPYLGPYESMQCGSGQWIFPMAEFWQGRNWTSVKVVSSLANGYGKPVVAAESFTANAEHGSWRDDPYSMKAFGDWMYCLGVNRFIFHSYVHQPWLNVKPGMKLGRMVQYQPRKHWFEVSGDWMKYLARCQYMLQIGRTKADVAYFCGQGSPNLHRPGNPPLPRGYSYDSINADLLMNHARVENGRLVLKSGANYAVLVLTPDDPLMTPELLGKSKNSLKMGSPCLAPRPRPRRACKTIRRAMRKSGSWCRSSGAISRGKQEIDNTVGKGRVILGKSLETVLNDLGVSPACQLPKDFEFIHKQLGEMEYFFVSNQTDQTISADVVFRVAGKVPELFHPDTGKIESGIGYSVKGNEVTVPLTFDPSGSVFVMFRKEHTGGDRTVAPQSSLVQSKDPVTIRGPWKLSFRRIGERRNPFHWIS
jgi:hypothetical protein